VSGKIEILLTVIPNIHPDHMKKCIVFITVMLVVIFSHPTFSQTDVIPQEFGITTGAFSNFPCNRDYLNESRSVLYIAPYIRTGNHEFSVGLLYPLATHPIYNGDDNIYGRPGATAGYKFYIFNVYGRENLFVHYSFQYLLYKGTYLKSTGTGFPSYSWNETETNTYINNVIGLGYNLFLDANERFGFFYILDYVITQGSYRRDFPGSSTKTWTTDYAWNFLSTHLGFSFKICPLKKKEKK
jgi:hypothetical protein